MKRAIKAKVVGLKILTHTYSRKLPESIKNTISFDVIRVKILENFREKLSLVAILCFRHWRNFQKWGAFQRSKGRSHETFSRGKPSDPRFCSLCSHLVSAYSIMKFVPTGLSMILNRLITRFLHKKLVNKKLVLRRSKF